MPSKGPESIPSKAIAKRTPKISQMDGLVTMYVNSANVQSSFWDFKMRLGQILKASTNELEIGEIAHVYMSPQHAKAFSKTLQTAITNYEKSYGEIQDPPTKFEKPAT